jgi:hypothetical protein
LKTTTTPSTSPTRNPLVPLLIIVLAILVLEIQDVRPMEAAYRDKAQVQAIEDLKQRTQDTVQSNARIEKILSDLLALAKTDPDARAIVDRYQIRDVQPPQGTNR